MYLFFGDPLDLMYVSVWFLFYIDVIVLTFSVEPFVDELNYGNARDNGLIDSSEDSEDSNDECNYRNEYPDTEDDGEDASDSDNITERDMRNRFNTMDIGMVEQLVSHFI